jgi:hypothetical protein
MLKQQSKGLTSDCKQQVWVPAAQRTQQLVLLLLVSRVPVQQQQAACRMLL